MTRMAGQRALLAGALGAAGAIGADRMVHDQMDRLAQGYKAFEAAYYSAPEPLQQAYAQVYGGEMSNMDRIIATAVLGGSIPPPQGEAKGDTPAGAKAIETAALIRQKAPEVGNSLAALADQEMELFTRYAVIKAGGGPDIRSADVVAAAEAGAGTSPLPAAIGGVVLGATGAALPGLWARRPRG